MLKSLTPCYLLDSLAHLSWTPLQISHTTLVFDGGSKHTPPLTEPIKSEGLRHPWVSLRIVDGDLYVPDEPNPKFGLIYDVPVGFHTPFIQPPRKETLSMTGLCNFEMSRHFCECLNSAYAAQKTPYVRGVRKVMFSSKKNCLLGTQPKRGNRGIREKTYHASIMPPAHWDFIIKVMKSYEKAYCSFIPTNELVRDKCAREVVEIPHLSQITNDGKRCQHFGGMVFGINVHLNAHTDDDFGRCVVSVHVDNRRYCENDDPIVYFCFPRLGCAVPLRPGDAMIFNANEPHGISSKVNNDDSLYCVSMYLKTSLIGLNDNSIELTPMQDLILKP